MKTHKKIQTQKRDGWQWRLGAWVGVGEVGLWQLGEARSTNGGRWAIDDVGLWWLGSEGDVGLWVCESVRVE